MLENLKKSQKNTIRRKGFIFVLIVGMGGALCEAQTQTALMPSGPYVGIDGGVNHMTASINEQVTGTDADKLTLGGTGFTGNLLLGWSSLYDQWYTGVEAFGGINTSKDEKDSLIDFTNSVVARRKLEQQYQFGGALHLGRQVQNTLLFVRLGVVWSGFKLSREQFLAGVPQNDGKSQTKVLAGFQPGFGMAVKLSDCLMFKTLFTYSLFQSYSVNRFEARTVSDKPILSVKPRSMAFTVGINWYFSNSLKS